MPGAKKTTLSIVTVSANDTVRLARTFESLALDALGLHFLLICPDGDVLTQELFQELEGSLGFPASILHDSGAGIYEAMNLGLRSADSEYVMFWNSGDCLNSGEYLTNFIEFLEANLPNWGVVQGNFDWRNPQILTQDEVKNFSLHKGGYVSHQCVFAKRKLLLDLGGFESKYKVSADTKLTMLLWLNSEPIFFESPLVKVEIPAFSGVQNRIGRWENFKIIFSVLPLRYKIQAILNSLVREYSFLTKRLVRIFSRFKF